MKIEEFEKLTKVRMTEEYKILLGLINEKEQKINNLERECESKVFPQAEPEDEEYDGIPWSELPEDKLVEVVRSQNLTLNKQARKIKKLKRQKQVEIQKEII